MGRKGNAHLIWECSEWMLQEFQLVHFKQTTTTKFVLNYANHKIRMPLVWSCCWDLELDCWFEVANWIWFPCNKIFLVTWTKPGNFEPWQALHQPLVRSSKQTEIVWSTLKCSVMAKCCWGGGGETRCHRQMRNICFALSSFYILLKICVICKIGCVEQKGSKRDIFCGSSGFKCCLSDHVVPFLLFLVLCFSLFTFVHFVYSCVWVLFCEYFVGSIHLGKIWLFDLILERKVAVFVMNVKQPNVSTLNRSAMLRPQICKVSTPVA